MKEVFTHSTAGIRGLMGIARYLFPLWAAAAKLHGLLRKRGSQ